MSFRMFLSICVLGVMVTRGLSETPPRPNVLFIAVDDLNAWPACLGKRPDAKTPHIDRLAARGTLFTRAYCPAPSCNPSRAAVLTGVRPATSGVYNNDQPWRPALQKAMTLPRYFLDQGYLVHGGGKIFHGGFNDAGSWEKYVPVFRNPEPANKPLNGLKMAGHFDWGPLEVKDDDMGDHKLVSWAKEFLEKKHDKAFFLAVGLTRPHLPFYAPKKYFDLYPLDQLELPRVLDNDLDDVPPLGVRMARPQADHQRIVAGNQWKKAVQAYLACMSFADEEIGRLLDALDASPHGKNTIVVLWGDHGWHLGEKQHWRKSALWEEATRTILTIAAPGTGKAGQKCERVVNLMDVFPTLVELCGLRSRTGLEARSLVPLLADPKAAWNHPTLTTKGRNNHAIRSERWRYIRYSDGGEELYDHDADPLEWKNLAKEAKHDGIKKELAGHLPKVNAADAPRR